ncbi:MAG TPA: glycosyltransferase, partial [Mucilaginibacter sp.]|nr:glycosyltransferase [Mucilaginibacter sp.]
MPGKHICIVTQSHLCRNPRVVKEAKALAQAGYRVTILNSSYDKSLSDLDRNMIHGYDIRLIPVVSLEIHNAASFKYRIIKKAGDFLVRNFKMQTPLALGYGSLRYKKAAMAQNADLYICHQELGLYCGVQLLKLRKVTAFDFEDWYSEDLLEEARRRRPLKLLQQLEKIALQKGAFCTTTSASMAAGLAKRYRSPVPEIVYNSFAADDDLLSVPKSFEPPLKLFWFSQTIGPGRGLEQFLQFSGQINTQIEIHLLGQADEKYSKLLSAVQNRHKVVFHPLVPPDKLAERIAGFDIGLALEETRPASRDLTITNKFFQYIDSGLPVIATATLGQKEIFDVMEPGFLIDDYDSPDLATRLENWLKDSDAIKNKRENAVL